jgi:peptidoglycan/LPS O-acetylase OafA/YrhL
MGTIVVAPADLKKSPYRLFGGLRLLLAALVFLQHALRDLAPASVENWLRPLEAGSIAVLIFFVLSGFIVTEAAVYFYRGRPVAFFINRLLRIIPSYIIALILTLLVAAALSYSGIHQAVVSHVGAQPEFSFKEFLVNAFAVLPGGKGLLDRTDTLPILVIAWALRIELAFYGVLFAAFAAAHWLKRDTETVLTGFAVVMLALWVASAAAQQNNMVQYIPYFVFGCSMFYAFQHDTNKGGIVAMVLAAISGLLCVAALLNHESVVFANDATHSRLGAALVFVALTVIWLLLLFWPTEKLSPTLVDWDKRLGEATYPLYLLHTATSVMASALFPERGWLALAFAFALSLAASFAAAVTYEKAIGRLRTAVRGREL